VLRPDNVGHLFDDDVARQVLAAVAERGAYGELDAVVSF